MISRIRAYNFLSLRDVEVELSKLSVFVGPNASGKSNIIKALMLLGNHARRGCPVGVEGSGPLPFTDLVHNYDNYSSIDLRVEIPHNSDVVAYDIKVRADGYEEKVSMRDGVTYRNTGYGPDRPLPRYVTNAGEEKSASGVILSVMVDLRYPGPPETAERRTVTLYESVLKGPPPDAHESIHIVSRALRGLRAFRLDPTYLRFASSITEAPDVGYRGEGLARFLLYLYLERRRDFERVEEVVRSLVPEVEEVVPHVEGTNVEVWLRSKGLRMPLRPGFVSDGTIRLVAIAALLYAGLPVVAIEEPENHVHPYLLEALVDLARRSPSQVIFTTHSPYLLDYLKPEEVYVVGKVGAETRVKSLVETEDVEAVRKFLEEGGTLGEAWFSRVFGEPT